MGFYRVFIRGFQTSGFGWLEYHQGRLPCLDLLLDSILSLSAETAFVVWPYFPCGRPFLHARELKSSAAHLRLSAFRRVFARTFLVPRFAKHKSHMLPRRHPVFLGQHTRIFSMGTSACHSFSWGRISENSHLPQKRCLAGLGRLFCRFAPCILRAKLSFPDCHGIFHSFRASSYPGSATPYHRNFFLISGNYSSFRASSLVPCV